MQQLDNTSLPMTWASDFFWNRHFNLQWDFTSNIHASFSSGTNAEIEQPNVPVNKSLYPNEYEAWKDSVWRSVKHFGTPLTYQQSFDFSWKIPLNKIPVFNWITPDLTYRSTYGWNRGAYLEDGSTLGNTINNTRDINGNLRLNMLTLYNNIPFLKKVNRKFSTSTSNAAKKKDDKGNDEEKKFFTSEIQLLADTTVDVAHNRRSKNLRVRAFRQDGTSYPVRYKVVDNNHILITSRDTAKIKITVSPRSNPENQFWYKALQTTARLAMSVRNVSISYKNTYSMSLPGFLPNIGDMFGQRSAGGLQPGLDFAFGMVGESYISKAQRRGWLLSNDSVTTPAATSKNESLQISATLEPLRDFKIDLTASRTINRSRSIQYMFNGMPATETGSFNMTTISISSAFASIGNAKNNYENKTFTKFVNSLPDFRNRVEAQYTGTSYPVNSVLAGKTFDPANGTVSQYSSDVMIPAFLSAYCGGSKNLKLFPSLMRMLPNWRLTYSGLGKLRFMKPVFKTFNVNHSYQSVYSVGSYNTFSSFMKLAGDRGFVNDVSTGNPVPSSMYDISNVSINETFSPFLGFDMTFNNNLTAKVEYNRTRMLSLSLTSQQIAEARLNDYVIGVGYKVDDLKLFSPTRRPKRRGAKGRAANSRKKSSSDEEKSEDTNTSRGSRSAGTISNDLNLRLDLSLRNQSSIQRNILTMLSQATSGNKAFKISFSADYTLSKLITLSAYYDRQTNTPLLSSSSYPTTTQDFGVSIKVSLTR